MAGEHTLAEPKLRITPTPLTGFEINKNQSVHDRQKYLQVKHPQVCLFCKLLIYTYLAQWNYGWDVLNIVQTYQSGLTQINLSHLYTCLHGQIMV